MINDTIQCDSQPSFFEQHKVLCLAVLFSSIAHLGILAFHKWPTRELGPTKSKITVSFVAPSLKTQPASEPMVAEPVEIKVSKREVKPLLTKNKPAVLPVEKNVATPPKNSASGYADSVFGGMQEHKAVTENTKDYLYAQYFDDWKKKVERIGTMNYPQEVQYASLMLTVVLRQDGSVESAKIIHSSGNKIADEAAINTVMFAAPFAKFPPEMAKQVKYLDITKTWTFSKNRVSTK